MDLEQMEAMLPTKKRKPLATPLSLVYLAITTPKWGKTTFFSSFPEAVLIAFERGFQFQNVPTIFIDEWHNKDFEPYVDKDEVMHMTMTQCKQTLVASDKYKFLIIDTADMAAKKCSDYYLQKHRWQHAQDGGDFGRGYDIVQNTPFRQMIGALMATGRGIAFTTHQQINETKMGKNKAGSSIVKKETSLPGGVYKYLHSQADLILHGSYGKRQPGNKHRDRIFQTEGDEEVLAGNRGKDIYLPSKYVVDPARPYEQLAEFFVNPQASLEADIGAIKEDRVDEDEDGARPLKKKVKKKLSTQTRR